MNIILEAYFKPDEARRPIRLVNRYKPFFKKLDLNIKETAYIKKDKNTLNGGIIIISEPVENSNIETLTEINKILMASLTLEERPGTVTIALGIDKLKTSLQGATQ